MLEPNGFRSFNNCHKDEMFSPSGEYSESRPFKIFISLLDKWEIGSALTDILVLDALKAIRFLMQCNTAERNGDVRLISQGFEDTSSLFYLILFSLIDFHDSQHIIRGCRTQHPLETVIDSNNERFD